LRIASRPSWSGLEMKTRQSKRPGLVRALSSRSALLVAAMKTTPDPERRIRRKIATNVTPELRPRCTTTAGNETANMMVLLFLGRLVTDSPVDLAG